MRKERSLGEALFTLGHNLQNSGMISDASQIFSDQDLPKEATMLKEICVSTITQAEPIIKNLERLRCESRRKKFYLD